MEVNFILKPKTSNPPKIIFSREKILQKKEFHVKKECENASKDGSSICKFQTRHVANGPKRW